MNNPVYRTEHSSPLGLWLALLAALLFAISGSVAADVFEEVEPLQLALIRSLGTALVLLPFALLRRFWRVTVPWGLMIIWGLILGAVTGLYLIAIERLGVGPGVTLQFLAPVLVLIWMGTAQRRRIPRPAWGAAALAILGTALMNKAWDFGQLDPWGVAAGLSAAVIFAVDLILGERIVNQIPPLIMATNGFIISAGFWLLLLPFFDFPILPTEVSVEGWAKLVWLVVAGTALPFLIGISAVKWADPGRVGVVATSEPVMAAIIAWVFLDQVLQVGQIMGAVMVMIGVAIIQLITTGAPAPISPTTMVPGSTTETSTDPVAETSLDTIPDVADQHRSSPDR